jgi:hypothetical protein
MFVKTIYEIKKKLPPKYTQIYLKRELFFLPEIVHPWDFIKTFVKVP